MNNETLINTALMTEEEIRAMKDFERDLREEERGLERDLERQKRFLQPITFAEILATALAEPDPDEE